MSWLVPNGPELQALGLSLRVALAAVVICLVPGLVVAWVLARYRFVGKTVLDVLVHLPLVLPPVVVGYMLLLLLGRNGVIGEPLRVFTGFVLGFDWKGAAVASAVMAFPLMVRSLRLSMEAVDVNLEDAATNLGSGTLRTFFTITLPLISPGIIAGTILAFARSLGEFGATITFVSNIPGQTRTLPLALFTAIQVPGAELGALRLCVIAVGVSMLALLCSELIARRMAASRR
jgi:molybdate transport system permease protein